MKSDIFTVIDDIDIFLTNSSGKEIEVSRMMLGIEITEGLFDFFLSGKLILADVITRPHPELAALLPA